jgi:hypothetical protein
MNPMVPFDCGDLLLGKNLWSFKGWSMLVDLGYDVINNRKVVRGRKQKRSPRKAI